MSRDVINPERTDLPLYELGNALRGVFAGHFASADEAWEVLGARFDRSFPSKKGRAVSMICVVREGVTAGGNETARDRRLREQAEAQQALDRLSEDA